MQKIEAKVRKDKKKNTETGILMGQNINIFSQLSASYLQTKSNTTQNEYKFLDEIEIIQYHDQQINRLIILLRKKAEITKIKAILQLKEKIIVMDQEHLESFIPTFAQLYQETIINQQSKQVYEEFITILIHILTNHKKIVILQIINLFGTMIISIKLTKLLNLLFTGTQFQQWNKCLLLLLKPQIRNKIHIVSKIILQCEQTHKLSQANYQRNCTSLMKVYKQIIYAYNNKFEKNNKIIKQKDFIELIHNICQIIIPGNKCIDQYFKLSGKPKAAILELYQYIFQLSINNFQWKIQWQKFVKVIFNNFLDKDPIVQQTMWKYINYQLLQKIKYINKNEQQIENELNYQLFNQYLPKCDDKLLMVLKIGGLNMYKQLPNYIQQYPSTTFTINQTHKSLIIKLNFISKLMINILFQQQDQNQFRIQCYYNLSLYFINEIQILQKQKQKFNLDMKKQKQIITILHKIEKQIITNLQYKFYSNQQQFIMKNNINYYLPNYFCKLLLQLQPIFQIQFHPIYTFQLYRNLVKNNNNNNHNQYCLKIFNSIFVKCQGNIDLELLYLQNFPKRKVLIDMTENNKQIEKTSKIFVLSTSTNQQQLWFGKQWDIYKTIIVYDPRITLTDIQCSNYNQKNNNNNNIKFKPSCSSFTLNQYHNIELDLIRFKFFKSCLYNNNQSISIMKYLIPLFLDSIVVRNHHFFNQVLQNYYENNIKLLLENKWNISTFSIIQFKIITEIVIEYLLKYENINNNNSNISQQLLKYYFENCCQFIRIIYNNNMQIEAQQLLKKINKILIIQKYQQFLFISVKKSIKLNYLQFLKNTKTEILNLKQQKIRKNKLNKCINFINHILWYILPRNNHNNNNKLYQLLLDLLQTQTAWIVANNQSQIWLIGHIFLDQANQSILLSISKEIIHHYSNMIIIIALLLNCQIVLPLQAHPQIRNKYIQLQNNLLKQITSQQIQIQINLISQLIQSTSKQQSYLISQGIKHLLKYILKNINITNQFLQQIITICIQSKILNFQSLKYDQDIIMNTFIIINTITDLPIHQLSNKQQLAKSFIEYSLNEINSIKCLGFNAIAQIFMEHGAGHSYLMNQSNLNLMVNKLLLCCTDTINKKYQSDHHMHTNYNFYRTVLFGFMNVIFPITTLKPFEKEMPQILMWLKQDIKQGTVLHAVTQSSRMHLLCRIFQDLNPKDQQWMIKSIPMQGLRQYNFYKELLVQIDDEQVLQLPHHQNIVNLFIQFAQFLIRITTAIKIGLTPQETTIVDLLQCPFQGVKKASFMLLKLMYELKLVPKQPPKIYRQILSNKINNTNIVNENPYKLEQNIYSCMHTWQCLLNRRQATDNIPLVQQQLSILLEDYVSKQHLYDTFFSNFFYTLEQLLNYMKNLNNLDITIEELLSIDFIISIQQQQQYYQNNNNIHLFKVCMKTFFIFISNFPIFLRQYIDREKKYRPICEKVLRNIISDGIFHQEVSRIEIKQTQWKKQGNFEVYVSPKNKQIYAEYQHQCLRIGLRLVMKNNYPLSQLSIEFGQGLKMDEGTRWALMLQSQLHNKNNTIINGILLWKANIDKKLAGVEECSICYDIVNFNRQLPKKSCKTCKKKFHGNCIMKWFNKSNKSQCPLCKSQFL